MNKPDSSSKRTASRLLLANALGAVVLLFFSVPVLFLLYGGAAGAIGGLAILALFSVVQLPIFLLLMRFGLLSDTKKVRASEPEED